MGKTAPAETDLNILWEQFREYVRKVKIDWTWGKGNRSHSTDVLEVMNKRDRQEVDEIIIRWGRYIEPLAEAWWKERGYSVTWPDDNSIPMKVDRLETV